MMVRVVFNGWRCYFLVLLLLLAPDRVHAELRAGAARVDISPTQLPVLVNGGMRSRSASQIYTRIHARAIVLDDGRERIGVCVVDSCILPRKLCDEAKALAASQGQLKVDRMLVSATHTHTAPSSIGALGTDADPSYVPLLRQKIAEAFLAAEARLQPARVGWGSGEAANFTALRRWVRRPDRLAEDPFGNPTVRASMHAARNPDDAIGPTGPEDPELSLIALQTLDGEPIAVLSNFSMHYFGGVQAVSADYFGLYCTMFEEFLSGQANSDVVAVMSHGCSGDIWRRDYMELQEEANGTIEEYSLGLLEVAKRAYAEVEYTADADLAMVQAEIPMHYRTPDKQRLEWAKKVVAEMGDRLPQTQPEIYAREQIFLDQMQATKILLQAIRIGDMAIATTPNETYALTGLKLKTQSPLNKTMVIELANGGEGYIPPPEQHALGGYNTWEARSAGLEVSAEPRIVATDLNLLEQVALRPRRQIQSPDCAESIRLKELGPMAYWRLGEMEGPIVGDHSGQGNEAFIEPGVLFYLDGPAEFSSVGGSLDESRASSTNRCFHFAGGRLQANLPIAKQDFSIAMSIWNGMPLQSRDVTGWFLSNDRNAAISPAGLHLGLDREGRLMLQLGSGESKVGSHVIPRWQWARIGLVATPSRYEVYLQGHDEPEISLARQERIFIPSWFFGGRSDDSDNWEGKLDEIVVFDQALSSSQISSQFLSRSHE